MAGRSVSVGSFGPRRASRRRGLRSGCASIGRTSRWASSTTWAIGSFAIRTGRNMSIEGPVAEDAASVAFGVMASGDVTAAFEAIGLAVRAADGSWTPIAVDDGGFEAAADASAGGWRRAGTSKNVEITRPTDRAPEGRQFLRMSPMSSSASSCGVRERALRQPTEERCPRGHRSWWGPQGPGADGVVRGRRRRERQALEPACGAPRCTRRRRRLRRFARCRHSTG